MDPTDSSDLRIAAIHEAGHVVMRHHHGLDTLAVVIYSDGTGSTGPGGGTIDSVETQLDVTLGGPIAEGLAGGPDATPTPESLREIVSDIEFGEPSYDDHYDAVVIARNRRRHWNEEQIFVALSESHERCLRVLRERWPALTQLADALVASPDIGLDQEEIESILGTVPVDRSREQTPPER